MTERTNCHRLQVAANLKRFIEEEALPGTGVDAAAFWKGFDALVHDLAPKNRALLAERDRLQTELDQWHRAHPGPVAIRYPRGAGVGLPVPQTAEPLPLGQGVLVRQGTDALVVAIGSRVMPAVAAADALARETGREVAVFNARFIKPLPKDQLLELAGRYPLWLTVEENVLQGGFGSAVVELLSDAGALSGLTITRLGLPDAFVEHGAQKALRALCGIDQSGIKAALFRLLAL